MIQESHRGDTRVLAKPPHHEWTDADHQVQTFLDKMAQALVTGDTDTLKEQWAVPSYVLSDEGVRAVNSAAEVEAFFKGAKDQYNSRGIIETRADIRRLEWLTERIAVADVRWPHIDCSGIEIGEECSTYTLRQEDDGSFKLCVALMRGTSKPS